MLTHFIPKDDITYDELWEGLYPAVHNWEHYHKLIDIADGKLEVEFWCSKNYEGRPFQKLGITFYPPDLKYLSDRITWFKEGTGVEQIIKDAVIDRLKVRIKKYLDKRCVK